MSFIGSHPLRLGEGKKASFCVHPFSFLQYSEQSVLAIATPFPLAFFFSHMLATPRGLPSPFMRLLYF